MTRSAVRRAWGSGLLVGFVVGIAAAAPAAEVRLDPAVKHQTIRGWSVNPSGPWVTPKQRDQVLDEVVNELGLTRMRVGPPSGNRSDRIPWEWHNDNGDPADANWAAFNTAMADRYVEKWVLPFKKRVEANGEPFDLWISPSFFDGGSTGTVPAWLLHSAGEYTEFATSFLLYLKKKHGLEADYYVVCNEPANNNAFRPAVVGRMIRTLGPRLKALGLRTKIQFPDCINADHAWRFIEALRDDPAVWPHVRVLSYHLYGRNDARPKIRDFAAARGLITAQTEHMGAKFDRLYADLTLGGASFWSIYGWGGVVDIRHDGASFERGRDYWYLRQVMHYVRPGAVRIEAASDDASLRALAFLHKGRATVVLLNHGRSARQQTVRLANLPAGRYGVCRSVNRRTCEELGVRAVADDKRLEVPVPKNAVVTVYPHPGTNQPPVVTGFRARPSFLTAPASAVTLSASATDPETDAVSCEWSVEAQPAGARAALATPGALTTRATGLSVPGDYAFGVTFRDATHAVRRVVRLTVFADNQPPKIYDLHNRIPVMVTLPGSSTILRAWPKDLEGDRLETNWSIVRQPAGASAALEPPPKGKGGRKAVGMTVAGDYVFRFRASDGRHDVHKDLTVTVFPKNRPPVISAAAAEPARLTLPAGTTRLAAKAADPDGDVISHWWSVERAPAGARPAFATQGAAATAVTGLGVAGEYVFTLTVVDRTRATRRHVKVTVRPAAD